VDLGITGTKNLLPQEQVQLGHKKPKNKELTKEQKLHNQHVSKVRVVVEHAIGGMKRYF
jgi:hypothetical protein